MCVAAWNADAEDAADVEVNDSVTKARMAVAAAADVMIPTTRSLYTIAVMSATLFHLLVWAGWIHSFCFCFCWPSNRRPAAIAMGIGLRQLFLPRASIRRRICFSRAILLHHSLQALKKSTLNSISVTIWTEYIFPSCLSNAAGLREC